MSGRPHNWDEVFEHVAAASKHDLVSIAPQRPRILSRIGFLDRRSGSPSFLIRACRKAVLAVELGLNHTHVGLRIRLSRDASAVVVRGFMTQLLPLLTLVAGSARSKTLLIVNHNLQEASIRPRLKRAIERAARRGFRFVVFESLDPLDAIGFTADVRQRFVSIPHPG